MTCGHCASTISRAIAGVDKAARLDIRIEQKLVRVSSSSPAEELAEAIRDAGYTPQEVQETPVQPAAARAKSGCGCGCGPVKAAPVDAAQAAAPAGGGCCG
jgi:copper chaperone